MMRGVVEPLGPSAAASCWRGGTVKMFGSTAADPPVVPGDSDAHPSFGGSVSRPMSVGPWRGPEPETQGVSWARAAPVARQQEKTKAERVRQLGTFMRGSSCGKVDVYTRKPVSVYFPSKTRRLTGRALENIVSDVPTPMRS